LGKCVDGLGSRVWRVLESGQGTAVDVEEYEEVVVFQEDWPHFPFDGELGMLVLASYPGPRVVRGLQRNEEAM
jgi:hypothetical protein